MTLEVRPLGSKCNIQCTYCYQDTQRKAGNVPKPKSYDLKRIKKAIEEEGTDFSLFGGEPLLIPLEDLEELFSWGFVKFGKNGIQTNGTLISEKHIELFLKYNVTVGISIDGPGELNVLRWAGNTKRTLEATLKTERAIELLTRSKVRVGLITTLHQKNATRDKLPILIKWIRRMDGIGVKSLRLHVLEIDNVQTKGDALSERENLQAMLGLSAIEGELRNLRLDVFQDIRRLIMGKDNSTTCIWNACDPYTTRAVQGIEGHGQKSNCGRIYKDGVEFLKSDVEGFERYIALYHTPQKFGGCKHCRFFIMCKGQCPGTAIDGDWRNRTVDCKLWKRLFKIFESKAEQRGYVPLSKHKGRQAIEKRLLKHWSLGINSRIDQYVEE